jgi:hypothetical protein
MPLVPNPQSLKRDGATLRMSLIIGEAGIGKSRYDRPLDGSKK